MLMKTTRKITIKKILKKCLHSAFVSVILNRSQVKRQDTSTYGSLVKRLRRRPLTAKTGVRFPYELLRTSRFYNLIIRLWFVGQAAKTSPSHGENRGSIPLRTAES